MRDRIKRGTGSGPQISNDGLKKVSELRRAQIVDASQKPMIKDGNNRPDPVISHSNAYRSAMVKNAMAGPVTIPSMTSMNDMLGPEVYSPLFQLANLNLPRDRVTMNAWNRIFFDTMPLVRNGINLHASYPISKINISHPVKEVQDFFHEWASQIDLYSVVYGCALEFWKMGEVFPYAEMDTQTGRWKRITILNPDYVSVKKAPIGDQVIISLRPDAALVRLVNSTSPSDMRLKRRLPKHIVKAVQKGHTIPLDNLNVSHLKLMSAPYDMRGTSLVVSIYKDLMLYDKLRDSKFAQADGMVNPLTLVKIGSSEHKATQDEINSWNHILQEAQYDKDYKIVTHDAVTIERVGFSGGTLDISSDIELILNNIYAGLMVPKAIIDSEGTSYASSSIGLEVLRQRYDIFRNMIKKWLEQKIFAPMCEMNDFFEYKGGEKVLQVPVVDFNHMNLYDMADYISSISNFVGTKQVSLQTLYRSLDLSYDEEKRRLKEEQIDQVIREKELAALNSMRLRELENLKVDDAIPEPDPGEESAGGGIPGVPGEGDMGGGLPGLGELGGDLGGPPGDLGGGAASPPSEPPLGEI